MKIFPNHGETTSSRLPLIAVGGAVAIVLIIVSFAVGRQSAAPQPAATVPRATFADIPRTPDYDATVDAQSRIQADTFAPSPERDEAVRPPRPPADIDGDQDILAAVRAREAADRAEEIASRPRAKLFAMTPAALKMSPAEDPNDLVPASRTLGKPYEGVDYKGPPSAGYTPKGFQLFTGPRGGTYHMSKNGNKVYEKKK